MFNTIDFRYRICYNITIGYREITRTVHTDVDTTLLLSQREVYIKYIITRGELYLTLVCLI